MESFPFWVLVPLIAIVAWTIVTVTNTRARQHSPSGELARRLEDLERRVTDIEKRT